MWLAGSSAASRGRHSSAKSVLSSLGGPGRRTTILPASDGGGKVLAGGAAGAVGENRGAVEDIGLLEVVGRHGDAAVGEASFESGEEIVVAVEGDAQGGGYGLAGEVVFGGAEAAGEEDDVGAGEGDAGGGGEVIEGVADDGLEGDLDAEIVELLR